MNKREIIEDFINFVAAAGGAEDKQQASYWGYTYLEQPVITKHIYICAKCGGDVPVIKKDGVIHSCNIRSCRGCSKKYYSKGILKCKDKAEELRNLKWQEELIQSCNVGNTWD